MKPIGIYQKILKGIIEFPAFLSLRSKDLIRKLLNPEVRYRLGVADVRKYTYRMGRLSRVISGFEELTSMLSMSVESQPHGFLISEASSISVGSIRFQTPPETKMIRLLRNNKSSSLISDLSYLV